jgi:hypothetical protein
MRTPINHNLIRDNPCLTQWSEQAVVKQIVSFVVVCFADVERLRVAANQRTGPAMLVVYDRGTEHVEAPYEYNKLTTGTISPRMTVL